MNEAESLPRSHFHSLVPRSNTRVAFRAGRKKDAAPQPPRYFLYARKSSEPDDRQALSIESQKTELLASFGSLTIVDTIEESRTAKEPGRPKFDAMMRRLEKGEADGIIAWHPDRLSRNSVDAGRIIYDLDLGRIKDLKFAGYNFENSPEGKWMLSIVLSQSKYFVDKLSKDIRRGLKAKLAMGWRPGACPIGYLNDPAGTKGLRVIVPDPQRFALVRRMWDMMLSGAYSPAHIAEIANREWGLRTVERKVRGGKPLSRAAAYDLFSNPFYTGAFDYDGQLYDGKHAPMVSEAEFWRVQELLGRRGRPRAKTKRDFAYTGLMRCGECGCMVTAEEKTKVNRTTGATRTYVYYHCTKKKRHLRCRQPSVEVHELEEQLGLALLPLSVGDEFLEWALQYLRELRATEQGADRSQRESAERAFKGNLRQLDELLNIRLRGLIQDDEFEAKRAVLLREQGGLKANLNGQADTAEKGFELVERTCRFALHMKNRFEIGTSKEKRIILENVGSNLRLRDKILHFEPVEPFGYFNNAQKKSEWWSVVDDVRTFCTQAMEDKDTPTVKAIAQTQDAVP